MEERELFKKPLTAYEIEDLLGPRPVEDLLSTRSPEYKARGLDRGTRGEAELLRLMEAEPRLLRRPILHYGEELLVGFEPSRWEKVLGHLAGTASVPICPPVRGVTSSFARRSRIPQ